MRSFLPSSLLLALSAVSLAQAAVHEHWWNITYVENVNPDGLQARRAIGVNGTWPPPPVVVTRGDTLKIHAHNGLGDTGTALHTHGNFFNGSSYMDGAVGVTQCPIPPGATFDYEIPASLQEGTYWIHGHYAGQYTDGLATPFIILPNDETRRKDISWDHEYTIVLRDWYHDEHPKLIKEFMSIYNPTGAEPVADAPLMFVVKDGQYISGADGPAEGKEVGDNAILPFEAGKKYKLRVINMSALAMFNVWIDGHDMKIIEADGVETEPFETDRFAISVAQRYSVLVEARNDTTENWVFHANMDPQMFDSFPDTLQLNISATVEYAADNKRAEGTTKTEEELGFFNDILITPLIVKGQAPADASLPMKFEFDTFDNGINRAGFNGKTYQRPSVPTIVTAMTMGSNSSNQVVYGAQTDTHVLNHMDMVELVIVNGDAGQHPFHLHGHEFMLVHRSFDVESDDPEINPPVVEDQVNPFRRDTVMIPPGGSTTVRFRADNPGAWIFHCHVDWHLSSGLASVLTVAPSKMQESMTLPSFMLDQCAAQNVPTSGNVVGKMSLTDFAGQILGPYPIIAGWLPRARGAMAGCVLSALVGMAAVVWYSWGSLNEAEIEAEEQRRHEQKMADKAEGKKHGVLGLAQKVVGGGKK